MSFRRRIWLHASPPRVASGVKYNVTSNKQVSYTTHHIKTIADREHNSELSRSAPGGADGGLAGVDLHLHLHFGEGEVSGKRQEVLQER